MQHPEEMNKETLYDLRSLLARWPYYQTARLLMLKNLYLLHDPGFDEELRRAAIYITDRKVIFEMVEAVHYRLNCEKEKKAAAAVSADRTSSLIDNFLESLPEEDSGKKTEKKRKPTAADAAVDYVAYLLETEGEEREEEEQPSRTMALIDNFMGDGGFKLPKNDGGDYQPEFTPELDNEEDAKEEPGNSAYFTDTLARIYIKQGKYEKALEIIQRLYNGNPQKSIYYVDQMRFLEKLIINSKNNK